MITNDPETTFHNYGQDAVLDAYNEIMSRRKGMVLEQVEENLEGDEELAKESFKDGGNTALFDHSISVTPLPFSCDETGKQCSEENGTKLEDSNLHDYDESLLSTQLPDIDSPCECNGGPCKYCKEVDDWLTMDNNTLEAAEVSKDEVLNEEAELEEESENPPSQGICEQLFK